MSTLEHELIKTIVKYNRKQVEKSSYDPTALGKYVIKSERALTNIEGGTPVTISLAEKFTGHLLAALVKAAEPFEKAHPQLRSVG